MNAKSEIKSLNTLSTSTEAMLNLILQLDLLALAWALPEIFSNFILSVLIGAFAATRLRALNNILHECSHGHFARSPALNARLGRILSSLFMMDFRAYRKEHQSHHSSLGDYQKDLDFGPLASLKLHIQPTFKHVLSNILSLRFVKLYMQIPHRLNISTMAGVAFWLSICGLLTLGGYFYALISILLSHVFWFPLAKYIYDLIDHGGIYQHSSRLLQSRNFIIENRFLRSLLLPRNDCYHLIHHLFPFLAVRNFSKAHQLLLKSESYAQLKHQWHESLTLSSERKVCDAYPHTFRSL